MADALGQLRAEVEQIVGDPDVRPGERLVKLRHLRAAVRGLLGTIESAMGDQRLVQEASAAASTRKILAMRANADVRDNLVGMGHDPEELSAMGFYTHAELNALKEEGLLEEAAADFDESHMRARPVPPEPGD